MITILTAFGMHCVYILGFNTYIYQSTFVVALNSVELFHLKNKEKSAFFGNLTSICVEPELNEKN